MSTKLSSWKHYVKIDHWEKDEWGDTFMVDMNGKRWLYCSWIGRKGYSYDPSRQIPMRPIIRTMKQNRKVIFYIYHPEIDHLDVILVDEDPRFLKVT